MESREQQLLHELRGDAAEAAFEKLMAIHRPWVQASAQRQVRRLDLAEDVTQATFLVLWNKRDRLALDRPLSAWLFKVLRYAAMTAIREETRRKRRERVAGETMATTNDPPTDEILNQLDESLAQLSERDREATLLRFYERRSFADVGEALGVSEDAARKRVDRAIEKLRTMFARQRISADGAALAATLFAHAGGSTGAASELVFRASPRAYAIAKGTQTMLRIAQFKTGVAIAAFGAASVVMIAGVVYATRPASTRMVAAGTRQLSASQPVPFQVDLPSGMKLHLLGVMPRHQAARADWISPDGRRAVQVPFRQPSVNTDGPQIGTFVAFEVVDPPPRAVEPVAGNPRALGDIDCFVQLEPTVSYSGFRWIEAIEGQRRLFGIAEITNAQPKVIRFFIAAGEWQSLAEVKPDEIGKVIQLPGDEPHVRGSISLSSVTEREGHCVATFEDPSPAQRYVLRVSAVDDHGYESTGTTTRGVFPELDSDHRTMVFDFFVPQAKVRSFKVAWRPYEVVDVTGISMATGKVSEVRMTPWSPLKKP